MSYTIIIDETERARQKENLTNRTVRHCRIGKVRQKTGIKWVDTGMPTGTRIPPYREPFIWRGDTQTVPWWMQGPWCNQANA